MLVLSLTPKGLNRLAKAATLGVLTYFQCETNYHLHRRKSLAQGYRETTLHRPMGLVIFKVMTYTAPRAADPVWSRRSYLADMLVRVGHGDRTAFQALYIVTSIQLFDLCLQIVRDRNEAEEVLQDAYINIWKKAGSFDNSQSSPTRWLAAVTRNCAIDQLREKKKRKMTLLYEAASVVDPAPLADEILIEAADWRLLHECIVSLDQRDAYFIKSAFFDELTHADLAAKEGQPLGSVKSVIRRALLKLKDKVEGKL